MFNENRVGDYPIGAKNDSRAPYNESLNKEIIVCVSLILDGEVTISIPENTSESETKYLLDKHIKMLSHAIAKSNNLVVTNIEVYDE